MTKHALITGASSGIGLATVQKLLQQGVSVAGIARDFSRCNIDALTQYSIDLANLDALPSALAEISDVPDILVLNAGYGRFGGLEQFSYQQIQQLINTNLVSNLFLLKYFLPTMKQRGQADIVIVGSESALQGGKSGAVYCASKFGMRGLAQSLRADCATSDVRVMLVNPGPVDSEFFADLDFAPQDGEDFSIPVAAVAEAIFQLLQQPRNVVTDEINLQPIKRSFRKS